MFLSQAIGYECRRFIPVSIRVDAATSKGDLHRIWRYFGADEPNYAYMKDGRKLFA